jgi:PKD repeat protein
MPALLYAAKTARAPYITPAGPDALNVATAAMTVSQGTPVALTATINDTRYNNSNGTEPTQAIAAAEYYLDIPHWVTTTTPIPYPMAAADGTFNSPIEGVTATVDTSNLTVGRHIIFVRGQDTHGNWGAVSAVFLDITPEVAPQASFTSTSPDPVGTVTSFTNTSTGAGLSYAWDFGDTHTSTAANPTHQYGAVGIYTVTLTVTNAAGSDTYTDTVEILPNTLYLPMLLKP